MEKARALEADLHYKIEEAIMAEENRTKLEERLLKVMKQNRKHAKSSSVLAETYKILKVDNEWLQLKIKEIQARFQAQVDSFVLEKTYVVYSMQKKTLEDAKIGFKNIDDCIAEVHALEITSLRNIPARPTISSSS